MRSWGASKQDWFAAPPPPLRRPQWPGRSPVSVSRSSKVLCRAGLFCYLHYVRGRDSTVVGMHLPVIVFMLIATSTGGAAAQAFVPEQNPQKTLPFLDPEPLRPERCEFLGLTDGFKTWRGDCVSDPASDVAPAPKKQQVRKRKPRPGKGVGVPCPDCTPGVPPT